MSEENKKEDKTHFGDTEMGKGIGLCFILLGLAATLLALTGCPS